jgi:Peptidase family S41
MQPARMMFIGLLTLSVLSFGDTAAVHLTREQAVKDVRTFFALLESAHPDPYTNFGGKIEFQRRAQKLIADLPPDGLTVPELTDRLSAFLALLKDGHTRVRGNRSRWQDPGPRQAVEFGIASDALVIAACDLPALEGVLGDRLVEVNGHSIPELLSRMSAEVSAENEYGTYYGLTIALRSFKLLHNLIPDLDHAQGVRYTLEDPSHKRIERTVFWDGEHPDDPQKWSSKPVQWNGIPHPDQPYYYSFLQEGKTAYIRIANMTPRESYEIMKGYHVGDLQQTLTDYYKAHKKEMPADFDAALQGVSSLTEPATQMLQTMKQRASANLIIDLRGNGGGSTPVIVPFFYEIYGDAYFGRNNDAEFVQVKSQLYMEKYHSSVEEERKKDPDFALGDYEFTSGNEPGTAGEKRDKKFAEWDEHGLNWSKPLRNLEGKPLYRPAKVIVLCDPGTFSAAFQAMFILHQLGATVVGVPSAQSPNAFMEGTEYVLPESGIRGLISNGTQMFVPHDPKANVFHPDFQVTYSILANYGGDTDTALRYALDLLKADVTNRPATVSH